MKTNQTFENTMAGRRTRPVKPTYDCGERDITKALIVGAFLGLALTILMLYLTGTSLFHPLDMNRDGRITLTDLVVAKRAEIQIKAKLLGEPDAFAVVAP
jgi:hypothetical protein